jgi:hypothetical protein
MPNVLTVTGNTRLTWSLSDGTASTGGEAKSGRSIVNGTGPYQANVAWGITGTINASGVIAYSGSGLPFSPFGSGGQVTVTRWKELLFSVVTGPTGGHVTFSAPGITGVRVGTWGQVHFVDYALGTTGSTNYGWERGTTGTYEVSFNLIGNGSYASEC